MSLIDRFVSVDDGKRLLIDALSKQSIVAGNRTVAEKLADTCKVEEFARGAKLIEQGGSDNDILFLLMGSVDIVINGREISQRSAGQHIGEMALIDVTASRSASVVAKEGIVIARVSEPDFTRIATDHAAMWRLIAIELASRLRHEPPPLKWSDLKYVIWHQGGPICRGRGTSRRR